MYYPTSSVGSEDASSRAGQVYRQTGQARPAHALFLNLRTVTSRSLGRDSLNLPYIQFAKDRFFSRTEYDAWVLYKGPQQDIL